VTHIINAAQQVRAETGLEKGAGAHAFLVDIIFIRIKHIDPWVSNEPDGDLEKRVRCDKVIVVQKSHILPAGEGDRGVGIAGNAQVLLQVRHFKARVSCCQPVKQCGHFEVGRVAVRQAAFPGGIGLVFNRVEGFSQNAQRWVVYWHHDADKRVLR